MSQLAGTVSVVTGAGQGVGRGIALALAAAGSKVALLGRTQSKLDAVAAEIDARGGVALVFRCDVKDAEQIEAVVSSIADRLGPVRILVNNAMEFPIGTILEVPDATLHASWESGPLASLRLMRACHPHLAGGRRSRQREQ
jgi:NAD(P)-dependent dehydrogenase (short-subunit alcohol dehydrogenase family)